MNCKASSSLRLRLGRGNRCLRAVLLFDRHLFGERAVLGEQPAHHHKPVLGIPFPVLDGTGGKGKDFVVRADRHPIVVDRLVYRFLREGGQLVAREVGFDVVEAHMRIEHRENLPLHRLAEHRQLDIGVGRGKLRVGELEKLGEPRPVGVILQVAVPVDHRIGGKAGARTDRVGVVGKVAAVHILLFALGPAQVLHIVHPLQNAVVDVGVRDPQPCDGIRILGALIIERLGHIDVGLRAFAHPQRRGIWLLLLLGRGRGRSRAGLRRGVGREQLFHRAASAQSRRQRQGQQGTQKFFHGFSSGTPVHGLTLLKSLLSRVSSPSTPYISSAP